MDGYWLRQLNTFVERNDSQHRLARDFVALLGYTLKDERGVAAKVSNVLMVVASRRERAHPPHEIGQLRLIRPTSCDRRVCFRFINIDLDKELLRLTKKCLAQPTYDVVHLQEFSSSQ